MLLFIYAKISQVLSFFQIFQLKCCLDFLRMRATCFAHLILLGFDNGGIQRVQFVTVWTRLLQPPVTSSLQASGGGFYSQN